MAANTRYHRLPEDTRPSIDSINEDSRLITPIPDSDDSPPSPNKKEFEYRFHPTFYFRFVAGILFLATAIHFLVSHRQHSVAAAVINLVALGREIWVLLHHLLTRLVRVRVRIELRGSRSSISVPPGKRLPSWLLLGAVQAALDLLIVPLVISLVSAVPHHRTYYHGGGSLAAKILSFVALGLHVLSIVDLGQPSRVTWSGKLSFDDTCDGNDSLPQLPIYRGVDATGTGEVGAQRNKIGTDSPPEII
ncbi:hypothetical protein LZ554_009007 [Drepanopeziza brunnea f. sp. 'monogermtubi']|nr:hypothetical protein LZ554_009007 [Drepanopeziza brunnea f. sp. 'monogermtubi']